MSSKAVEVSFLLGGGQMGARMRAYDWSRTTLGPVEQWPQSLKTAVRIMLTSRQAMFVWWGEELINLYNDAYMAIVGGKHPDALGQPASRVWREIWDQVGPRAEVAMRKNEGTYDEALFLLMERHGYQEETYYTFSYSPVPNDDGSTGGILCANTDDTQRIISGRQLALLRDLAAETADARTLDAACTLSATCLERDPHDLPFSMIYLLDETRQSVRLAGTSGIERGHAVAPETVVLGADSPWPFGEVLSTHKGLMTNLGTFAQNLPTGAWPRPPHEAVAVPIAPSGLTGRAGVLIVGLNPFRMYDDTYRGFVELVSSQIAASLANAQAYAEERKRAESLAELDRAKTAFFSNVSHEFRTPLTLMLGPLEDLLQAEPRILPAHREQISLASRNGLRLLKLVNTLLDFSRIEAGRVQAVYEPTDLPQFTAELASVFRSAIERAGLQLVVACPPVVDPVYIDRDMWEKIVLNLLSNAFKFTFAGRITVELKRHAKDTIDLIVHDTGIGIPDDQLSHVFERFHRVTGAQGRTHEGTGIGLALVQELVKLHNGTVRVESRLAEGTRFIVSIPLGHEHLPADRIGGPRTLTSTAMGATAYVEEVLRWLPDGGPEEDTSLDLVRDVSRRASDSARPSSRGARILLADDNADMRNYIRRLLADRYDVEAVADGQAALDAARRQPPDLVLTDVMMPHLDGFGLLQALRADARTQTIPVILLSARAGEESRVEGLEAGADDYLIKPFSARELTARVHTHLEMARLRRETQHELGELSARLEARVKELQTILEVSPVGIAIAEDPSCEKIWANDVLARLLRLEPETNVSLSAPADERLPYRVYRNGREVHADYLPMQRAIRQGISVRDEELDFVLPDGTVRTVLSYAEPLYDGHGGIRGGIYFGIDITERKESHAHIRKLNEELSLKVQEYEEVLCELEASKATLQDKIVDLETFHDVVVGRELKMMELEKENARLHAQFNSGKTEA